MQRTPSPGGHSCRASPRRERSVACCSIGSAARRRRTAVPDSRFPWAPPKHELLLIALVALAALLPVYTVNAQDEARLCLTQALVHGKVSNDECLANAVDKASFDGHFYSDK